MIAVRRIGPADGPLLKRMRLTVLADRPGEATDTLALAGARPDEHWASAAATNADGVEQATFFAETDDRPDDPVVGMVAAYRTEDGGVTLFGLWSAPGFRDIGVGHQLVEAVLAWAGHAGAFEVRSWVVNRNEHSLAFYRAMGFRPTGAAMAYERDPSLDQVEMVRALTGSG